LSGFYNRVQVVGGNWEHAYSTLGITKEHCEQVRKTKLISIQDNVEGK